MPYIQYNSPFKCWQGYERVPGTKPGAKGSCRKSSPLKKEYRGVLKARINKLYGGDVTVEKARKLKARPNATNRDKQLANWFINMQTNR